MLPFYRFRIILSLLNHGSLSAKFTIIVFNSYQIGKHMMTLYGPQPINNKIQKARGLIFNIRSKLFAILDLFLMCSILKNKLSFNISFWMSLLYDENNTCEKRGKRCYMYHGFCSWNLKFHNKEAITYTKFITPTSYRNKSLMKFKF